MQPLDKAFMCPFKTYYAQAIEKWLKHHPGHKVTIYQIGEIFGEAFAKAATYNIAVNGFRGTGLFRVNRNYFQEYKFISKECTPASLASIEIAVPAGMSNICESPEELSPPFSVSSTPSSTSTIPNQTSVFTIGASVIGPLPTAAAEDTFTPQCKKPSPILITDSPHKKSLEEFKNAKKKKKGRPY